MRAELVNPPPGSLRPKAVTDLPASPWWIRRDVLGELTGETGYKPAALAKIDGTWATLRFKKVGTT